MLYLLLVCIMYNSYLCCSCFRKLYNNIQINQNSSGFPGPFFKCSLLSYTTFSKKICTPPQFWSDNIWHKNANVHIYFQRKRVRYFGQVYRIHFKKLVHRILIPLYTYLFVAGIFGTQKCSTSNLRYTANKYAVTYINISHKRSYSHLYYCTIKLLIW